LKTIAHLFTLIFVLFLPALTHAQTPQTTSSITLEGHLDAEQIEPAVKQLKELTGSGTLVLRVNATSGDLSQVLAFAKQLYRLKRQKLVRVVVYIEDNAVGPVAILPFLADELYISSFVSWGDIPQGEELTLPKNIVRSRVTSLIPTDHPKRSQLVLLAGAMVDPLVVVVDDKGWRSGSASSTKLVISPATETLVLNQNQLQEQKLVAGVLTSEEFNKRFRTEAAVVAPVDDKEILEAVTGSLEENLERFISFEELGPNRIGRIVIDDRTRGINQATWIYVRSALDYYKKNPPAFIILELNTPGGEVFASQRISDALKNLDTQYGIPTVAFINNWAISAGAMLAYSSRFIAIVKDAAMGAAEPVFAADGKMKSAPEKVNSALRADFGNRARFFNRDPNMAEAMVDKDIVLVRRHGKIVRLSSDEEIRKKGIDPDEVITTKGKLLTLNADQLIEFDVADFMLQPHRLEPITPAEEDAGKWPAEKFLLFHHPFFKKIPDAMVDTYEMDWKTHFFAILASPAVASFLVLGMMLGFYIEINSPGFGFPGSLGLLCLFLIILSSFSLEAVGMLEFIFLMAGALLVLADIMLIPTFGLLGIAGVVLFLVGLFGLLLPGIREVSFDVDTQTVNAAGEVVLERFVWICGAIVVGTIAIFLLARYVMPTFSAYSRLVLTGEQEASKGFVAGLTEKDLPAVGSAGIATATLRPAGKVVIDDVLYDAVSVGTFIEEDTPIVVVRTKSGKLVVDAEESQFGKT